MARELRNGKIKFTDEAREKILFARSKGLPLEYCAYHAGVSSQSLKDWIELGKLSYDDGREDFYSDFFKDWMLQSSDTVIGIYDTLDEKVDPKSLWRKLEVMDPDVFNVARRVELESEQHITAQEQISYDDDVMKKVMEDVDARRAGLVSGEYDDGLSQFFENVEDTVKDKKNLDTDKI